MDLHTENTSGSITIEDIKQLPQWMTYRVEDREGHPTKIPYAVRRKAGPGKTNEPAYWGTFDEAISLLEKHNATLLPNAGGRWAGVGFVFTKEDPYMCIDLDNVVEDGEIVSWAREIINKMQTYTEYSRSGNGIHIIAKAKKPGDRCRAPKVNSNFEIYEWGRFFVFTGDIVPGSPSVINDAQAAVNDIYTSIFGSIPYEKPPKERTANAQPNGMSDPVLVDKAMKAKPPHGDNFYRLWNGDISDYNGDDSSADLALCNTLAFWTDKEPTRMDRLFRESGLMRSKWDDPRPTGTYGSITIQKAIDGTKNTYSDFRSKKTKTDGKKEPETIENELGLPIVRVNNRQLSDIGFQCLCLLKSSNDAEPTLFVRSGQLSQVCQDEHGSPYIKAVTQDHLLNRLSKLARFITVSQNGDEKNCHPPKIVADWILAEQMWPFPGLDCIAQCPGIRPDGSLSVTPGYDSATKTYNHFGKMDLDVPENPTKQDISAAVKLIGELLYDFPFDGESSKTNYMGLLLSAVLRPAFNGCVPLHLVDAPQAGSGKSLLSQILGVLATGEPPQFMTAPVKREDWPKVITASLAMGASLAIFDNIVLTLDSGDLASVLTTTKWNQRLLGTNNQTVNFPNRCLWIATGNNISLAGDIPRRCVWIRIDPEMAKPHERTGFKHPDIIEWTKRNRGPLLSALLILCRSWYASNQPKYEFPVFGSFEEWTRVIGSVLAHTGWNGFLGNANALWDQADTEGTEWELFLSHWLDVFGNEPITVKDLVYAVETPGITGHSIEAVLPMQISDAIWGKGDKCSRIGFKFKERCERRYGSRGLHLIKGNNTVRGKTWLVKADNDGLQVKPVIENQGVLISNGLPYDGYDGSEASTRKSILEFNNDIHDNSHNSNLDMEVFNPSYPSYPSYPFSVDEESPVWLAKCGKCGMDVRWKPIQDSKYYRYTCSCGNSASTLLKVIMDRAAEEQRA